MFQLALTVALNASTPDAVRRYKAANRPIIFADDQVFGNGLYWTSTPLHLEENSDGLHVQGVALKTSVTSMLFPGMHYCKVMSPYRAMEWINVDSLRKPDTHPSHYKFSAMNMVNIDKSQNKLPDKDSDFQPIWELWEEE